NTSFDCNPPPGQPVHWHIEGRYSPDPATATATPTDTPTLTPTVPTNTPTTTPTATPGCPGAWSVVTSPNVNGASNYLWGVSAVSASDIWAAGYYGDNPNQTLTMHFDGAGWTI